MKPAIILFIITLGTLNAQVLWLFSEDTVIGWTYAYGDEFADDSIKESQWHKGFPWGKAMLAQSNYVLPSNYKLENGYLNMVTKPLDSIIGLQPHEIDSAAIKERRLTPLDGNKFRFDYSTALIWSKTQFQYGYFEIKFKGVVGQGIWPAFWLYGGNPNYEIDFFELKGERENSIHVDLHCPEGCANHRERWFGHRRGWGHWIKTDQDLSESFNIVSGQWTSDGIWWYLNGEPVAYSNQKMNTPMSLIIGTGVAREGGPFSPGADKKTPFPNIFSVDYVRVYQANAKSRCSEKTTIKPLKSSTFGDPSVKAKRLPRQQRNPLVTISVVKQGEMLVFRCLGLQNNQQVRLSFSHKGNTIQDQTVSANSEFPVKIAGLSDLTLHIEALGRVITYKLN